MGRHLWELRSGRHHSLKLQRSFAKYGEAAFEFKILFVCDREQLELFESRAITGYDSCRNGYNVAAEAKGGFMRGRQWPEETKAARIEEIRARGISEENRRKIIEAQSGRTDEQKRAHWDHIGDANRKPKSEEGRKAIAQGLAKRYQCREAHDQTAEATKNSWVARREKYGPTGRKPKNNLLASVTEEVIYG